MQSVWAGPTGSSDAFVGFSKEFHCGKLNFHQHLRSRTAPFLQANSPCCHSTSRSLNKQIPFSFKP
ncbi:MAG: hypothetical protein HC767_12690 [Akkermansiaceae bacterium]|nr:hypothetical protein [Akkermansiaceae bacterium]